MFSLLLTFLPSKKSTTSPPHLPIYNGVPGTATCCKTVSKSATLIQSSFRGYIFRKKIYLEIVKAIQARREENRKAMKKTNTELSEAAEIIQRDIQEQNCRMEMCLASAATRIQKVFRGYLVRKKIEAQHIEYFLEKASSLPDEYVYDFIRLLTEKYADSHMLSKLFWEELRTFDISEYKSPPYATILYLVIPKFKA